MGAPRGLAQRLLGLSLFAKILIANSAVVALGAVAGTYLTAQHVRAYGGSGQLQIMAFFGGAGLLLSVLVNALVLRAAFAPLRRLEGVARRVIGGDLSARATPGVVSDPDTEELASTFNTMLDNLQVYTGRLEEYSVRLQELSDQVLMAQEEERRRIARELHDETGQELSTLLLGLRLFRDASARERPDLPALRQQAKELSDLARAVLDGVRRLALELRPRMLEDLGLATALRAYVEEWTQRTRLPVTFSAEMEDAPPLPATTEIAIYRTVQEALVNIAKHANATEVRVSVGVRGDDLVVEVADNGQGMVLRTRSVPAVDGVAAAWRDGHGSAGPVSGGSEVGAVVGPGARESAAAAAPTAPLAAGLVAANETVTRLDALEAGGGLSAGVGLFGAQERLSLVGGRLTIESAPGQGTVVRATVPLPERATSVV